MAKNNQQNLFEEGTAKKFSNDEQIVNTFKTNKKDGESAADAKMRRDFNSRIKAISRLKNIIENKLPTIFRSLNELYVEHVKDAEKRVLISKVEYLEKLHFAYQKKSWNKTERDEMFALILDNINELTQAGLEIPDKYADYTKVDLEQMGEFEKSFVSSLMKEMTGIDEIELEDVLGGERLGQEEFFEKYSSAFTEDESEAEDSTKELNSVQKDIRKIYKSLAKKIHPDLEQDEEKRREKEQLMQQLTAAKDKDDLFSVIMVQAKINQYEDNEFELSKDTMKEYSKTLLEERKKLEMQEWQLKNGDDFNAWLYKNFYSSSQRKSIANMNEYKEQLDKELTDIKKAMTATERVKTFKHYLKEEREKQQFYGYDDYFPDFFMK